MSNLNFQRWIIPAAFAIIYIVWGSTYLANWYAIQDIPPLLMSGSRFVTAGLILYLAGFAFGAGKPTVTQWKHTAFTGILLLTIGTGGMVWSEQFISSGMVALMAAFQPLLIVLMLWQMQGKRPTLRTIAGTLMGMAGMVFLVGQDQFTSSNDTLIGLAVIFVSILAWGFASVKIKGLNMPSSKLQSAGMQMLTGGVALVVISLFSGEMFEFSAAALTARGVWSWIYLVLFGSVVAFSAFNYLLIKSTPDKVATANYVNPVVALLLGWGFNSEEISGQSLIAAVLLLTGVIFINTRVRLNKFGFIKPHPVASLVSEDPETTTEVNIKPAVSNSNLIARIWHGTTASERTQDYVDWAKQIVVPGFNAVPGNVGMTLQHKTEGEVTHLTFISYWKDIKSIKNFAGEDYNKALFFPKEKEYLLDYEERVVHKTVMA